MADMMPLIESALLGHLAKRPSAAAAGALIDMFTTARTGLRLDYMNDPTLRAAYLAGFVLPNAAKTMHCLRQASLPRKILGYPLDSQKNTLISRSAANS